MKKYFLLAGISAIAFACGNNATEQNKTDTPAATEQKPAPTNELEDKGVALIAGSDCLTCHKVNEKSTGPAYMDVSKKYEATEKNIDSLAAKILRGGTGVWGQVPMTPHPQLAAEDAKTMVKYILSLKNQ